MERRAIEVLGIVQGVGFRPYIYSLACHHGLGGFVRNHAGKVVMEIEGDVPELDRFLADLKDQPPPLAHIESLTWIHTPSLGERTFRIEASDLGEPDFVFVSPDVGTCPECLAELFEPTDRRFNYPFLNCTRCGPRLTIVTGSPYDRAQTTLASFTMCSECRAEYDDPANRRFHAQPTACPTCGPRLVILDSSRNEMTTGDPLGAFARSLLAGQIGALKGLGGYHLVCDARNSSAVSELRRRKHRDEKPFAVMVADVAIAKALCEIGSREEALLRSPQSPIVLLRKRTMCDLPGVAPGNPSLGVMLPYSPLHHLLIRAVERVPLVMTSGNRSDEPTVYRDNDAKSLDGIADLYLSHDRPIHVRCDDSVVRVVDELDLPVRRSRGYAPRPVPLPVASPQPLLAVGGQFKSTFALARGCQAFFSHHIGDLDHPEAFRGFERDVQLYERLFEIQPAALVHDLHPDYASTAYALKRAATTGVPLLGIQHHHAHMASCMAEHGLTGAVIGVTFDGTGFGPDGTIWGGEFLTGDYRSCRRAGRLRPVPLPGGDVAIKEPWRTALSHILDAGCNRARSLLGVSPLQERLIRRMLERRFNCPLASSMGRLFDAVAALANVRRSSTYEGQAAIELEGLAVDVPPSGVYPFAIQDAGGGETNAILELDTRPLVRAVLADVQARMSSRLIARRFHSTVVEMIAAVCDRLRAETSLGQVVLSGGVFLNALLTRETCARLCREGFVVYRHRLVPPNDGGLSLGQAAIAAAHLSSA